MAKLLSTFVACQILQLASGEPVVSFPINSQLPPVARISQLFTWSFSQYTFKSDQNLTYTLGDHPSWLSIESDERRLYGTPQDDDVDPGDVVGQTVEVIATDDSGSATLNATLVVSRNEEPVVEIPISDQIKDFGHFSAPSSVLSLPSTSFEYAFDPDTFGPDPSTISYYAVSENSSPLPAWIKFDTASLTFSGQTPPVESLVQPPQTFNFELVASDIVGFSATSVSFSIVVGSHQLTTNKPIITFNTTRGSKLSYDGLEDGIRLDGKSVEPGDLDVSTEDLPGWLSFDEETWELQGTPGSHDHSSNFTITFSDEFADTLDVLGVINIATGLFELTFSDMDVYPGDKLDFDIEPYLRDSDDTEVSIETDPNEDWIDLDGFHIVGQVPKSASGNLKISVTAVSKSSGEKETEVLHISFVAPKADPTSSTSSRESSRATTSATTSTTSHHSATETSTDDEADSGKDSSDGISTGQILLATVLPILFIAMVIIVLVCIFRRRRNRKTYLSSKYRNQISQPVAGSLRVNGSDPSIRHIDEKMMGMRSETQFVDPAKSGYARMASQASSGSRSDSESLGRLSTPDLPPGLTSEGFEAVSRNRSNTGSSVEERHSWFTVEGTTVTGERSEGSRSRRSDTTMPDILHPSIPPPPGVAFRGGLDVTIPTLDDDFTSIQPTPDLAYQPPRDMGTGSKYKSADVYSMITSSSEALPRTRSYAPRPVTSTTTAAASASAAAVAAGGLRRHPVSPLSQREEEESASHVPELRAPSQARLSSSQWFSGQRQTTSTGEGLQSSASSKGAKSLVTETSFGSSENWRVIGGPARSYRDLVDAESQRFGDDGSVRRGSQDSGANWRRGDSGKGTEGSEGSFTAFL